MVNISVVILTKNEENNILDCIESVQEVFEIIIVDDDSTDRTFELLKGLNKKNIRVFTRSLNGDFASQRNYSLRKSTCEWVLFVDADERVPSELLGEIGRIIKSEFRKENGYKIKRRDMMWEKELKFGETGNTKLLRLARRNKGEWRGKVHETWEIEGQIGLLESPITHYPHPTIKDFLAEINAYSTMRANELYEKGVDIALWQIIAYPKAKFFFNYFLRLGLLDGVAGIVTAFMMSFHSFLVRAKLWKLKQGGLGDAL